MCNPASQNRCAANIVDDAVAFFEGTDLYHNPYVHNGKHYLAAEQFTDAALDEEMWRILWAAALQHRLPAREEQIACCYFGPLSNAPWPLMVAVIESACGEPRFVCKYFDASICRPDFPRPQKKPQTLTEEQTAKQCHVARCIRPSSITMRVGLFTSMDICADHAQLITPQISPCLT